MAEILLTPLDVANARFAVSRAQETALAMHLLRDGTTTVHARWAAWARPRLERVDVRAVRALVQSGCIANLLTPTLPAEPACLEDELAAMVALPPQALLDDIEWHRGRPAYDPAADEPVLQALERDPERGLRIVAQAVRTAYETVVEPFWPSIEAILRVDIARRSRTVAQHGLGSFLDELGRFTLGADGLTDPVHCSRKVIPGGQGLILSPSVFGWSRPMSVIDERFIPVLLYPAHGLGAFWEAGRDEDCGFEALGSLIGQTRARILALTRTPSTTGDLADRMGMGTSTVNDHLLVLRDTRLVETTRVGRRVLYAVSPLGEQMLAS